MLPKTRPSTSPPFTAPCAGWKKKASSPPACSRTRPAASALTPPLSASITISSAAHCKRVIEFDNLLVNTIKAQFELHSGAKVHSGSVVLYGLCSNCR